MKYTAPVNARCVSKSSPWLWVRAGNFDDQQTLNDGKISEDPNEPCEMLIVGPIGKDFWTGEGGALQEFLTALNAIPPETMITLGINSEGGNVQDGLGIYNAIRARGNVTCRVDGYACSIASIIAIGGKETQCPKTSVWMIHDPWSFAQGNADDMRSAAAMLEAHAKALLDAYVEKTGMDQDECRKMMKAETWLSGAEAADLGFANLVDFTSQDTDTVPTPSGPDDVESSVRRRYPRASKEISRIFASVRPNANAAKSAGGSNASAQEDTKSKGHMTEPTKTVPAAAATPADTLEGAQIMARLHEQNAKHQAAIDRLNAALAAQTRANVEARIDAAIADRRIPIEDRNEWVERAVSDPKVLDLVGNIPQHLPADNQRIELVSSDVRDVSREMETAAKVSASWRKGDTDWQNVINSARETHTVFSENADKMRKWVMSEWNRGTVKAASSTNTISSDVQRTVILNDILRAFKKRIIPLSAFSTIYNNVALQGTNKVSVPYYPLSTTSSTDFVDGTGYTTNVDTNNSAKTITINKRKFQAFTYTSSTLRRQPYFNVMQHLTLKAEQLGVDMWLDVLSLVTNANYEGTTASVICPAAAFDYDKIADLSGICNKADWPDIGRSVFIDSDYDTNIRKDIRFVSYMNSQNDETLREGVIGRAAGFDVYRSPRIPSNSENLKGFAAFPSAILCATSPIEPAPGVRQLLVRYELVSDPYTGVSFTYRHGGNATTDEDQEVIEVAYGYAAGEAAAIKRITSS